MQIDPRSSRLHPRIGQLIPLRICTAPSIQPDQIADEPVLVGPGLGYRSGIGVRRGSLAHDRDHDLVRGTLQSSVGDYQRKAVRPRSPGHEGRIRTVGPIQGHRQRPRGLRPLEVQLVTVRVAAGVPIQLHLLVDVARDILASPSNGRGVLHIYNPGDAVDLVPGVPHFERHAVVARFGKRVFRLLVRIPVGLETPVVVEIPAHLQLLGGIVAVAHFGDKDELGAHRPEIRIRGDIDLRRLVVHRLQIHLGGSFPIGIHRDQGVSPPNLRVVALSQGQLHLDLAHRHAVHPPLQPSSLHRDVADDIVFQRPSEDTHFAPGDRHLVPAGAHGHVDHDTAGLQIH